MTDARIPHATLIRRIGEMPMHLCLSGVLAVLLLAANFLPSLTMRLFGADKISPSFLTLLMSGSMSVRIHDAPYTMSFGEAAPFLLLSFLLPALLLVLLLLYPLLSKHLPKRVFPAVSLVLFAGVLFSRTLAQSRIVPEGFYAASGLARQDLYFMPTLPGNLCLLAAVLGILFTLYGTIGITVRIRMLSYPYFLWLLVFTVLPLLLIFIAAFFAKNSDGQMTFTLDGFRALFVDRVVDTTFYGIPLRLQEYFSVFLRSLDYAVCTTVGCLLIAYPLAYFMASRTRRLHSDSSLMLMFFVLPMWINTMLRTYAWRAFFGQTGVLNNFLLSLHMIGEPILFLKLEFLSDFIVKLVLVNDFLPFMLLPIYSVLVKLDENVEQAAHDLGANARQAFLKVILPLSLPGVISGIQMVFMPSLTFYMIPDIISEGSVTTVGTTVQAFILSESPVQQLAGNALSLLLLIFVLITMGILRNSDRDSGGGGMIL